MTDRPKLYVCDFIRNSKCGKDECIQYGGDCMFTTNPEMRDPYYDWITEDLTQAWQSDDQRLRKMVNQRLSN